MLSALILTSCFLTRRINGTKDFESLLVENEKFLSLVMIQSFIDMKPVRQCIASLLDVCHLYHRLIGKLQQCDLFDSKHREIFEKVVRNFNKHCGTLYRTLTSVMGYQPNPFLCQLLLRLDYNGHFSQHCGQILNFKLSSWEKLL